MPPADPDAAPPHWALTSPTTSPDITGLILSSGLRISTPTISTIFRFPSAQHDSDPSADVQIPTLMCACYDPKHRCEAWATLSLWYPHSGPLQRPCMPGFPVLAPHTPNTTAKLEQAEQQMFLVFCLAI